jgi:hypothetical protein
LLWLMISIRCGLWCIQVTGAWKWKADGDR